MNKVFRFIIIAFLVASFAISPLAGVQALGTGPAELAPLNIGSGTIVPNQYIVVFKPATGPNVQTSAIGALEASGGKVIFEYGSALNGFAASLPEKALLELRLNPQVAYIEADQIVSLVPLDEDIHSKIETVESGTIDTDSYQDFPTWGLDRIDQHGLPLDDIYTYLTTGAGVNVYIIDTGIRSTHTQFTGRATKDFDSVGDTLNGNDCNGHGTHVAGTIGGVTYGVAKAVRLHGVRVLDCNGSGTYAGVIAGINWVSANRIKPSVANMSLGGDYSAAMTAAVTAAIANGVTFVVAAGNDNANACNYSPASTPTAITVGATAANDYRASYSNWGPCLDIFAPGSNITSAWNYGDEAYNTISGTSMASPHVAGVAALYLQAHPTASPLTVAAGLINFSTKNVVIGPASSANRLLYSQVGYPPDVPNPITPEGAITDITPTFTWSKVNGATSYQFVLYRSGSLYYAKTVDASSCGTVNCENTPTTVLPHYYYTWKIHALVGGTWRAYSDLKQFNIIIPPTIPTLIAPINRIADSTPGFTWTRIQGATQYEYALFMGTALQYTKTMLATACGLTRCTDTPTTVLPYPASYSWKVRAMISGIWLPYSVGKTFIIVNPVPTAIVPNSKITDNTPTFSWTMIPGASQYEYLLYKGATLIQTVTTTAKACGISTCASTSIKVLVNGSYTWKVRAMVGGEWKAYSAGKVFSIVSLTGFNSQFTSDADGWTPQNGSWSVASGFYRTPGLPGLNVSSAHIDNYTTLTYEVKMLRVSGDYYANYIHFRGSPAPLASDGDWNNGYRFTVSNDGYFHIGYNQNGNWYWILPWISTPSVSSGWNTLRVTMNGTFVQFFINGDRVAYGNLTVFSAGQVGFGYYRDTYSKGDTLFIDYATLAMTAPASSLNTGGINLDTVSPVDSATAGNPDIAP
jgi:subtilisin family serine protease/uncharacterized protein YaiE (UPF0345 family)